jgi:hypothetical protein
MPDFSEGDEPSRLPERIRDGGEGSRDFSHRGFAPRRPMPVLGPTARHQALRAEILYTAATTARAAELRDGLSLFHTGNVRPTWAASGSRVQGHVDVPFICWHTTTPLHRGLPHDPEVDHRDAMSTASSSTRRSAGRQVHEVRRGLPGQYIRGNPTGPAPHRRSLRRRPVRQGCQAQSGNPPGPCLMAGPSASHELDLRT